MTLYPPELRKLVRRNRLDLEPWMGIAIAFALALVILGMVMGEPK